MTQVNNYETQLLIEKLSVHELLQQKKVYPTPLKWNGSCQIFPHFKLPYSVVTVVSPIISKYGQSFIYGFKNNIQLL